MKHLLLIAILLGALTGHAQFVPFGLSGTNAAAGGATLWNNLTFHLNMNESGAVDRTDNKGSLVMTHHGIGIDGPTSATGLIGNASDYEANNAQYLDRADNANVSFANESFTVSVWVNLESEVFSALVSKGNSSVTAANISYLVLYRATTHRFEFKVSDGSTIGTVSADTFGAPSLGTWYHVVCRHRQGSNIGIQVNTTASQGTEDTAAWTNGVQDESGTFYIGVSDTAFFYDGLIDEVSLFREALSSVNVTALWNAGAGLTYP